MGRRGVRMNPQMKYSGCLGSALSWVAVLQSVRIPLPFSFGILLIPRWLSGEEFACDAGDTGDTGLIPGWGRFPGKENGNLLQYSCLDNLMDREA